MGIVRDITVDQLTQAVGNIDTSTLAQDSTLQDVVTAISNISGGSDPVTNTTVNSLCKDTTGQSIASAISGLGTALGSDKANISGDNIANPSAFRQNIGAQANITSITITTTKRKLPVGIRTDTTAPDFGYAACYGGTQGTTLTVDGKDYSVSPSVMLRVPVAKGDVVSYIGGGYTNCNIYYQEITASIT